MYDTGMLPQYQQDTSKKEDLSSDSNDPNSFFSDLSEYLNSLHFLSI